MSKLTQDQETALRTRYTALREPLGQLGAETLAHVAMMVDKATAYVWGWQDALDMVGVGGPHRDTGYSLAFGHAYGIHVAQFKLEQRHNHHPISSAFRAWMSGKRDPAEW